MAQPVRGLQRAACCINIGEVGTWEQISGFLFLGTPDDATYDGILIFER
jgi:hypothetical protein